MATGCYVGEGFDEARLDTLLLALPVSWRGTLQQYAGRLNRLHPTQREVRIYDYLVPDVPVLARMYEKRRKGYRALGYVVQTTDKDAARDGSSTKATEMRLLKVEFGPS